MTESSLDRKPSPLSARETELLRLLADGKTRAEIARDLGISVGTVHNHIRIVHAKLGARTTPQALATALRNGWV